jgi:hypothetical protein
LVPARWGTSLGAVRGSGIAGSVGGGLCHGRNRVGEGREERERKRAGLNSNFLKILHCNLKNLQHESCGKLKNLPVLFYAKVQLISSFGVNLNSLEVELFVIFLFKIQILVKVSISFS